MIVFATPSFAGESDFIKVGNMVFISGQVGGTVGVPDNNGSAIAEAFQAIRKIAQENGGDLKDIVRLDIYLADLPKDFAMVNKVEEKYFSTPYPTRTTVGAVVAMNHTVAINAIMILPENKI